MKVLFWFVYYKWNSILAIRNKKIYQNIVIFPIIHSSLYHGSFSQNFSQITSNIKYIVGYQIASSNQ